MRRENGKGKTSFAHIAAALGNVGERKKCPGKKALDAEE